MNKPTHAKDEVDETYVDRNLLALLLGMLCARNPQLRIPAGFNVDENEPDWPVLMMELPTGQISYHLPKVLVDEFVPGGSQAYFRDHLSWDGHSTEEKRRRIRRLLQGFTYKEKE